MLQDSVPDGSLQWSSSCLVWFPWWLPHGAMDPSEGTLFRVTVDWPDFWIYTFELVIHLSKVKQLALPFCTISAMSRWSFGPRVPRQNACLSEWSRSEQPETPFFDHCSSSLWHSWHQARQVHACRFGDSFFWWLSGEVKHIVHPIRWNLKAVYAIAARLDHGPGKGITHDL